MYKNSVSSIPMFLEIKGKFRINCVLKRHLSPKTVGEIFRSVPIKANLHKFGSVGIYFEAQVTSGLERPKKEFRSGDIAFHPVGNHIYLFYKDFVHNTPMTPIGKIISSVDQLSKSEIGDEISLYSEIG